MKVAFADELNKSLSESELWQAIEYKMSFYFFLGIIERNKISSCAKEQYIYTAILQRKNVDERTPERWRQWKTFETSREILTAWKLQLGSLYRIAAEKMTMTLEGARRWDRQVERLDGIMDDIRQDFQMLVEDSSEEF